MTHPLSLSLSLYLSIFQVMQHLFPIKLCVSVNSPLSIFMKTSGHPVDLTFEPAQPQSLVDRTKAIVVVSESENA